MEFPRTDGCALPRRIRLDQNVPAELCIREAMAAVEETGTHPLLTDAVVLLSQALNRVSDFVDGTHIAPPPAPHYSAPLPDDVPAFAGEHCEEPGPDASHDNCELPRLTSSAGVDRSGGTVTTMEALDGLTAEDIYHANFVN